MTINPSQLPAPANIILADFIAELKIILPDLLEGIYLIGSIPLNDYYPKKSDIDFIVLLNEIPGGGDVLKKLGRIHLNIEKRYDKPKLNGYYLTPEGIMAETHFTSFFGRKMNTAKPFETDSIILFELKNASYTLYGKPTAELPVTISLDGVVTRLQHNINSYWASWITNHSGFSVGYLLMVLFTRLTEWGLLGVARQLYTLETGKIISKLNAGHYCLDNLPIIYQPVMNIAIETRKINALHLKPSFNRAKQTIACMAFIIQRFNNYNPL